MTDPLVSIVIASAGRSSLRGLLDSITWYTPVSYEIIVVSPPLPIKTLDALAQYHVYWIWEEVQEGCVKAFNKGFREAHGKYIVHLNDDCLVTEGWIVNMLELIGDRNVLGAFYVKEPDTDGFIVNSLWNHMYANFGMIKKDLMAQLGYWDERFVHYGADPDFGMTVWNAGYQVVATPSAKVIHHCIVDEHRKEHLRNSASDKLQAKWKGIFWK